MNAGYNDAAISRLEFLASEMDAFAQLLHLSPMSDEQRTCLFDRSRADEALDMLDDMIARCGLDEGLAAQEAADIIRAESQ